MVMVVVAMLVVVMVMMDDDDDDDDGCGDGGGGDDDDTIQYNTKFVKRHVAVASEALANCGKTGYFCNLPLSRFQRILTFYN